MDRIEVVFPTAGSVLALVLVATAGLLFWFGDRSRGRRRCPKCWYAMEGVPGLRCPECGHEARDERAFFRSRGRIRLAIMLCVLASMTYLSGVSARMSRGGVWGAAPTWTLTTAAGAAGGDWQSSSAGRWDWRSELFRRMQESAIHRWEAWLFVMQLKQPPKGFDACLTLPTRWRTTREMIHELDLTWSKANMVQVSSGAVRIAPRTGVDPKVNTGVEVEVVGFTMGHVFTLGVARGTLELVPPGASLFRRVTGEEATSRVKALLDPRIVRERGTVDVVLNDRSPGAAWEAAPFWIGYDIDVVMAGEVVGRGSGTVNWRYPVFKAYREASMAWSGVTPDAVADAAMRGEVEFVVRSVPAAEVVESQYEARPFRLECGDWEGEFRVKARVDTERERYKTGESGL